MSRLIGLVGEAGAGEVRMRRSGAGDLDRGLPGHRDKPCFGGRAGALGRGLEGAVWRILSPFSSLAETYADGKRNERLQSSRRLLYQSVDDLVKCSTRNLEEEEESLVFTPRAAGLHLQLARQQRETGGDIQLRSDRGENTFSPAPEIKIDAKGGSCARAPPGPQRCLTGAAAMSVAGWAPTEDKGALSNSESDTPSPMR
ncbi:hypothetical protein EYF80_011633 [Liparis tanakae]|uniref:Uncharacterized protein n=1 Tax=Liparis tanakae TaxID=230148 RepID=A0A4Z2IJY0_9TELE|nr:hypothetical protein EYF80_011633 [Liparis tanakae]